MCVCVCLWRILLSWMFCYGYGGGGVYLRSERRLVGWCGGGMGFVWVA